MHSSLKKLLIIFVFLAATIGNTSGQGTDNIHVHFDKDIYLPGDMIWFKAYIFNNNLPSTSTNLFAALYDEQGALLSEKMYLADRGTSNGNFQIPDSFPQQLLQLRVFTKSMLAADSNDIYLKTIRVYQRPSAAIALSTVENEKPTILIFPEGGSLVAGVNNHINFKLQPIFEQPEKLNAVIKDEDGKMIDSLWFNKNGMAKAQLIADNTKKYYISFQSGTIPFPATISNSASLHTEISNNKLYYSINRIAGTPRLNQLTIRVKDATDILYSEALNLGNRLNFVNSISTDSLPAGILSVDLLDAEANVLQCKKIFIQQPFTTPVITVREHSREAKGKTRLEIFIPDTSVHSFSIAVVDEQFSSDESAASIKDELLLKTETNYFRDHYNNKAIEALLSTQNENCGSQGKPGDQDNYLTATWLFNSTKSSLPENASLTLLVYDKAIGKQFYTVPSSQKNRFVQGGLIFFDSVKFYYRLPQKELANNMNAQITGIPRQPHSIAPVNAYGFNTVAHNSYAQPDSILNFFNKKTAAGFNKLQTVENVVIKSRYENPITKRMLELDEKYASGMYRGLARGTQFNLLDDPNAVTYPDIYSYLAYKIPSVKVANVLNVIGGDTVISKGFASTRIIGNGVGPGLTLLIDEVEATYDMLDHLPVSQIAYVKAITGIVSGTSFTTSVGVILVYTKKGSDYQSTSPSGMKTQMLKGYDMAADFSLPDYSKAGSKNEKDYRSTLYWDPYAMTDKNNRMLQVEYYNNDLSRRQVLIIKGFNDKGALIEIRKLLE